MKQNRIVILLLLVVFLLVGCAQAQTEYTVSVSYNGQDMEFTVNRQNNTISDGKYTYSYAVNDNSISITYPNGGTYYETKRDNGTGNIGWSKEYDPDTYIKGDTLVNVLENATGNGGGNPLAGLLLMALGAFFAFKPEWAWYLSHGWHYKNAEPSDISLVVARISGAAVIIIGLFCLFV